MRTIASVPALEFFIWSALMGSLIALAALAMNDVIAAPRSTGAWRRFIFVMLVGSTVVLLTEVPQQLWPSLPTGPRVWLRSFMGPLAAGVTLYYLGIWMGGMREDLIVHRVSAGGGAVLVASAILLAMASAIMTSSRQPALLAISGGLTLLGAFLGVVIAFRAAALGDPLARWMGIACVALMVMTTGLYAQALRLPHIGSGLTSWTVTALATLVYFTMASSLIARRNRENRRLKQLSNADPTVEPATGLPLGAKLVSEVEHAFWCAQRYQGQCAVVCLYLRNLYELTNDAGRGAEYQILVAMAARIRRAAGFRCVVGMYHARCFVVVISVDRHREPLSVALTRLRSFVSEPITVLGRDLQPREFRPQVGAGLTVVRAGEATALDVLNATELQAQRADPSRPEEQLDTVL